MISLQALQPSEMYYYIIAFSIEVQADNSRNGYVLGLEKNNQHPEGKYKQRNCAYSTIQNGI